MVSHSCFINKQTINPIMHLLHISMVFVIVISIVYGVWSRPAGQEQHSFRLVPEMEDKRPVIVGGNPVSPPFKYGQWLVAIMRGDYQFCAGSIYAPGLMVTAGHCSILGIPLDQLRVMAHRHDLSRSDRSERGVLLPVKNITVHPDFKLRTLENDIAVWQLDNTDQLSTPVQLDDGSMSQLGMNGIVMGWGSISEGGESSNVLRQVAVPITESDICSRILETPILDSMICAGGIPGQDACQGDSGGPLIAAKTQSDPSPVLISVVSWGKGCARAGYPGVYSRIAFFRDWLLSFRQEL